MKNKKKVTSKKQIKNRASVKNPAKKVGVIATIASLIEKAEKSKGITKDQIVSALAKRFPDHNADSLRMTVNTQVPGRISKERKMKVVRSEEGGYYKK